MDREEVFMNLSYLVQHFVGEGSKFPFQDFFLLEDLEGKELRLKYCGYND
jgi:hypothetical protein